MERAQPTKVLVADGNRDAADSLVMLLTALGYRARGAYDGEDALKLCRTWRPDTMIADIVLPRRSGLELAWALPPPRPHLIALTGYLHPDYLRQAYALFDAVLFKPVEIASLLAALAWHASAATTRCGEAKA